MLRSRSGVRSTRSRCCRAVPAGQTGSGSHGHRLRMCRGPRSLRTRLGNAIGALQAPQPAEQWETGGPTTDESGRRSVGQYHRDGHDVVAAQDLDLELVTRFLITDGGHEPCPALDRCAFDGDDDVTRLETCRRSGRALLDLGDDGALTTIAAVVEADTQVSLVARFTVGLLAQRIDDRERLADRDRKADV